MRRRSLTVASLLLRGLAIAVLVVMGLSARPVLAVPAALDPQHIVVTPADLPDGFTVDPQYTASSYIESVGPSQQVQYTRESTRENLLAGPIVVTQLIVRLDRSIGAGDALQVLRDTYVQKQGMSPSADGPNDGGTFTLDKVENNIKLCAVGFVKDDMVIVTITGGLPTVVTPAGVLKIAGISSAKMDAANGH